MRHTEANNKDLIVKLECYKRNKLPNRRHDKERQNEKGYEE